MLNIAGSIILAIPEQTDEGEPSHSTLFELHGSSALERRMPARARTQLPAASDYEAATRVVRAAKKVLRRKNRFTNPLDHPGPAFLAEVEFVLARALFEFLAADAEGRRGRSPQSLERNNLPALSALRTGSAIILRLRGYRFWNKVKVLGLALGALESV